MTISFLYFRWGNQFNEAELFSNTFQITISSYQSMHILFLSSDTCYKIIIMWIEIYKCLTRTCCCSINMFINLRIMNIKHWKIQGTAQQTTWTKIKSVSNKNKFNVYYHTAKRRFNEVRMKMAIPRYILRIKYSLRKSIENSFKIAKCILSKMNERTTMSYLLVVQDV